MEATSEQIAELTRWLRIGAILLPVTGLGAALVVGSMLSSPREAPPHQHDAPASLALESLKAQRVELTDAEGKTVAAFVAAPPGLQRAGVAVVDPSGRPRAVIETSDAGSGVVVYDEKLHQRIVTVVRDGDGPQLALYDGASPRVVMTVNETRGRASLVMTDGKRVPRAGLVIDDAKGESFHLFDGDGKPSVNVPSRAAVPPK